MEKSLPSSKNQKLRASEVQRVKSLVHSAKSRPERGKFVLSNLYIVFCIFGFSLFTLHSSLLPSLVFAQTPPPPQPDTNAIPPPVVPCLDEQMQLSYGPEPGYRNPEFHSLRPYQASPCGDAPKAYFCNNDYTIVEKIEMEWDKDKCEQEGGSYFCTPDPNTTNSGYIIGGEHIDPVTGEVKIGKDYSVQLSEVDYPILGNTQEVLNSQQPNENIDLAQRMNEYVNWYLQGVTQKAEYGSELPEEIKDYALSFAGPAKKLLPFDILNLRRLRVLHDAGVKPEQGVDPETYQGPDELTYEDPETGEELTRQTLLHNQIAVCTDNGEAIPCYAGNGSEAQANKRRLLVWWEARGSLQWETYYISEDDRFRNWTGNEVWGGFTPPFPWQFKNSLFYQKAYNEWRGATCQISGGSLSCIPGSINDYKKYYSFVPLGNANDKNSAHKMTDVRAHPVGQTQAQVIHFDFPFEKVPVLHYPHTESTVQVSKELNMVHTPLLCDEEGQCKKIKGTGSNYEPTTCEFVDVRSNVGDDLTFKDENVKTYFDVRNVATQVTRIECLNTGEFNTFFAEPPEGCGGEELNACNTDACTRPNSNCASCLAAEDLPPATCTSAPICKAEVYIVLPSSPKIPYINQIWENTVVGKTSPVRKIFPRMESGAPISCFKEVPGVSKVNYNVLSPDTNLLKVVGPGSENRHVFAMGGSGGQGELYFPHLGTIHEYFLKAIQTALRPLGYGSPITNGDNCILCTGEMPEFKNETDECSVGSVSERVTNISQIPDTFKMIIDSATNEFKVPGDLVIAALYGESLFNGGVYRGTGPEWNDENVTAWATCTPLPNCTDPASGLIYFGEDGWRELAAEVKPFVEALYPEGMPEIMESPKNVLNPCNLINATYVVTKFLDRYQSGFSTYPDGASCLGVELGKGSGDLPEATSCEQWYEDESRRIISAIRFWEFGSCYGPGCSNPSNPQGLLTCATKSNSCATGGGYDAQCDLDTLTLWDRCPLNENSHTQCLWDIAHGK